MFDNPIRNLYCRELCGFFWEGSSIALQFDISGNLTGFDIHLNPFQKLGLASGVKLPKKRAVHVKNALSTEQVRALLRAAEGSRWAPLWGFLLATGCRPQEALGLRWSDIDFDAATVQLGAQVVTSDGHGKVMLASEAKTEGSLRTVPLPSPTVGMLREHRKRQREEKGNVE